jgi:hypothetical protein
MKTENDCKPFSRYLLAHEIFSDETIEIWKGECVSRVNANNIAKSAAFYKFVNWNKTEKEIALFTLYAYADLKIPKLFNCIFELGNPENVVFANCQLEQSIYEGWLPIDTVDIGHKHLCIFSFEDEIPQIFEKLHIGKEKFSNVPKGSTALGICNQDDFEEIRKRQLYVNDLKSKHGLAWWKFDKELSE